MLEAIVQDLRYAARRLGHGPGFSATVIATLALGIGATTAIFSVVYGVLLRPLPYPEPEGLVAIFEVNHRGTYSRLADPNFDDFRDQNGTFETMAKYAAVVASVSGLAEPTRTGVAFATRDFFSVLLRIQGASTRSSASCLRGSSSRRRRTCGCRANWIPRTPAARRTTTPASAGCGQA